MLNVASDQTTFTDPTNAIGTFNVDFHAVLLQHLGYGAVSRPFNFSSGKCPRCTGRFLLEKGLPIRIPVST